MEILFIVVAIVVFFLCRRLILWYYRINESIELQKETNRLLRKIAGEPDPADNVSNVDSASKSLSVEEFNKKLYGD